MERISPEARKRLFRPKDLSALMLALFLALAVVAILAVVLF